MEANSPQANGTPAARPQRLTFTISETAAELRISRQMVYRLIARKALHVCRVGTRLRVRRVELERYLAQSEQYEERQSRRIG